MRYTLSFITASALALLVTPAVAQPPRVITDIPPVHALVALVMGDLGTPGLLLDQGADAHSFQLRPSQATELAEADLVVWIGPTMAPWLDRAVKSLAPDVVQRRLLDAGGTHLRFFGETEAVHLDGQAGEAGHDRSAGDVPADEGHDHDHEGLDPHAWLDPGNAQLWLGVIAADLARLDPANAAAYLENAARGAAKIAALDDRLDALLLPVRDKPFVVFHDAYGYFADHYALTVAGTVALGDAAPPGAAHLAGLRATLADDLCIFPETGQDPKMVETIAADTGARIGGALDPEAVGLEQGPELYEALLSGLAETLVACLAQPAP